MLGVLGIGTSGTSSYFATSLLRSSHSLELVRVRVHTDYSIIPLFDYSYNNVFQDSFLHRIPLSRGAVEDSDSSINRHMQRDQTMDMENDSGGS